MKQTRRYPGSRPFEDSPIERLLFRGRDKEKADLLNLILARDLVLLYARSGTGKTSLLNAGILEDLRGREFFPATVRLNSENPLQTARAAILAEAARCGIQVEQTEETSLDLVLLLSKGRFWRGDILLVPVIILDQFEELFTLHEQPAQEEIIAALSDLAARRLSDEIEESTRRISAVPYKLVFSIREDYLGEMESVAARIPTIMHHRFRLTPLTMEQARQAIREPAAIKNEELKGHSFIYSDEAINELIAFLSTRRDRQGFRQGNDVEPFQLQIVCQHIEDEVLKRISETKQIIISKEDLGGQEGMSQVLEQFYNNQLDQLPEEAQEQAHNLCEFGLISQTGKRISLEEDYIKSYYGVDSSSLRKLVELRLLRAEPRVGSTYYELSHDALVAAIQSTGAQRKPKIHLDRARLAWDNEDYMTALNSYIYCIDLTQSSFVYAECARRLMAIKRYKDAETLLQSAVDNKVLDEEIYIALGQLRLYQDRNTDAIAEFEKALQIKSDSANGNLGLGQACLNENDSQRAAECFRIAIKQDSDMADAHIGLLKTMINMRQFDLLESHVASIRQKEFFIQILEGLTKALDQAGAQITARRILTDTMRRIEETYDSFATIANAAYAIKEWEIADAALETASRLETQAQIYVMRGVILEHLNKPDKAKAMYTKALKQNPKDIEALLNRALICATQKQYDEAINDCNYAIDLNTDSARAFKCWGVCLSDQGNHQKAIEKFEQADQIKPGDSQLLALWADSLIDLDLYDQAMVKAREAVKADPNNVDALYALGNTLWATGNLEEANDHFQAAHGLDNRRTDILASWGKILNTMGEYDEANDKFKQAHRLEPRSAYILWNWGESLGDSGRYQMSIDKCRKALELDSENADAYLNLARSLTALGNAEEALSNFRKATMLAPNNAWAQVLFANALIKHANYPEAAEKYREAVKVATDDATLGSIYENWGNSLGLAGLHQEAEEKFRKALEIKTDIPLLCGLASEVANQGRLGEALAIYLQAERLGPKDASEFGGLGWGFYQVGEYDKSLYYSRRALELESNALYARCNAGLALLRLGKAEEAKKEYEQAIQFAEQTTDADGFQYHAVGDVEQALKEAPELPGGQAVLESLRKHLDRIRSLRTHVRSARRDVTKLIHHQS